MKNQKNLHNYRGRYHSSAVKRIVSLILSFIMLLTFTVGLDFSAFANITGDYEYSLLNNGTVEISKYIGNSKQVIIPNKLDGYMVTSIGDFAFNRCDCLQEVNISEGIIRVGKYAFQSCSNLEKVYISKTVTELADAFDDNPIYERRSPFVYCDSLKEFIVDKNNFYYSSQDGVLFNKNKTRLIQYPSGNTRINYEVPSSVIKIESLTMRNLYNLDNLVLPYSVIEIDPEAITMSNDRRTSITIYNSECNISGMNGGDTPRGFYRVDVIYGYKNSTAEVFTKNWNVSFVPIENQEHKNKFSDLQSSEYNLYIDYVNYTSVYNSFIIGTNPPYNTEFSPRTAVTRAMFVTILYRMAGSPYDNGNNPYKSSPFIDITNTSVYYYNAACWALNNSVTNQIVFKPNDNVSREQTATFLFRYVKENEMLVDTEYKNADISNYHDYNDICSWAVEPMKWANYNGMITGTAQGFANPHGVTQRIHATKILYGFGKACNIGNFE